MDPRLLEAALDLGATPWQAFWRVTVPLSKSGIIAGALLVFIPCVGEFVIPELLGGPQTLMIGRVLWDEFFSNNDWPMAASVAVVMGMKLNAGRLTSLGWMGSVFFFLYLPIFALVILSFNASPMVTSWGGWSLRWYEALANDAEIIN
eukprot:gene17617-23922_t